MSGWDCVTSSRTGPPSTAAPWEPSHGPDAHSVIDHDGTPDVVHDSRGPGAPNLAADVNAFGAVVEVERSEPVRWND